MKKISFIKMVASGNDFVVSRLTGWPVGRLKSLTRKICHRKYGVGADGLLVIDKSKRADVRMRIFNADGSEAQMCGNGARCVALYLSCQTAKPTLVHQVKIETKAGIIESEVKGNNVKIILTPPKDIKLDFPIKLNNRAIRVNFINTGVPHAVIFVSGIEDIDVFNLGRLIRHHRKFLPAGTNVDFVEVLNAKSIKIRTYERGVEDETLACGTGSVAAALIAVVSCQLPVVSKIKVVTKSGEVLKVYFRKRLNDFQDVCLEGKARIVYNGEFNY